MTSTEMIERPTAIKSETHVINTGCGDMFVIVGFDAHNKIIEVFAKLGKAGGCGAVSTNSITKMISYLLQSGFDIERIIKGLDGERCHNPGFDHGDEIKSCHDAIAKVLRRIVDRDKLKETG